MIALKRIYETKSADDGYRVLVDRLWPRGVTKEQASVNLWLKDIAPSTNLRKWFAHDPKKWTLFRKRYSDELLANPEGLAALRQITKKHRRVTLLFAAKDEQHNAAVVVCELLNSTP